MRSCQLPAYGINLRVFLEDVRLSIIKRFVFANSGTMPSPVRHRMQDILTVHRSVQTAQAHSNSGKRATLGPAPPPQGTPAAHRSRCYHQ